MNKTAQRFSEKDKKQDILDAYYTLLDQIDAGEASSQVDIKIKKVGQDLRSKIKEQVAELTESLSQGVDEVISKVEEVSSSLSKLYELQDQTKKLWEREQGEHDYELKRKRQQEDDAWKAERQKREEELGKKEAELKEAGEELKTLREKDKTFEARLAKSTSDAVSANAKRLQEEFEHKEAMFTTQAKAKEDLLGSKVDHLQSVVESQKAEIERLNKQNESANQRLTEIASGAVRNFRPNQEPVSTNQEIKK